MIQHVMLERLRACYYPEHIALWTLPRVLAVVPVATFVPNHERVKGESDGGDLDLHLYDLGRVHHFYDELIRGKPITPIEIDTECHSVPGGRPVWGNPFIEDGHHRYAAALHANQRIIPASCGGLVEQVNWLTGRRRSRPRSIEV